SLTRRISSSASCSANPQPSGGSCVLLPGPFCHSAPMGTAAFGLRLRANAPEGQKRFPISQYPRRRSLGWVNFVGRITLWTVSGSLLFLTLAGVSSTLWPLAPLFRARTALGAHPL